METDGKGGVNCLDVAVIWCADVHIRKSLSKPLQRIEKWPHVPHVHNDIRGHFQSCRFGIVGNLTPIMVYNICVMIGPVSRVVDLLDAGKSITKSWTQAECEKFSTEYSNLFECVWCL